LQALNAIVIKQASRIDEGMISKIVVETANLISDADLSLTHLTLTLAKSILNTFPFALSHILRSIYPCLIEISVSPLLQGAAQSSLIELFQCLVVKGGDDIFNATFRDTYSMKIKQDTKQGISNLAKCIAGICSVVENRSLQEATIDLLKGDLREEGEMKRQLALLCIGELGQQTDLGSTEGLKDIVLACFDSRSEDTKSAAAYALGHLAVGSMDTFLTIVLQALESNRQQYLLLASLKEIIVVHANKQIDFSPYVDSVVPGLMTLSRSEEEGVRNMVAECLGALVSMDDSRLVPSLLETIQAGDVDKLTRWTIASALRHALSRQPLIRWRALPDTICEFLKMTDDSDLEIKKATLLMINTAVHHNPTVIVSQLSELGVKLVETLRCTMEREVDLGPFKHKVDDGLPLRKAALTCIETILEKLPEHLDIPLFMLNLSIVLGDKDVDMKFQGHQILVKLCSHAPSVVLNCMIENGDRIATELCKTAKNPPKGSAGPEAERAQELVRSSLRAIALVSKLEGIHENARWTQLLEDIKAAGLELPDTN